MQYHLVTRGRRSYQSLFFNNEIPAGWCHRSMSGDQSFLKWKFFNYLFIYLVKQLQSQIYLQIIFLLQNAESYSRCPKSQWIEKNNMYMTNKKNDLKPRLSFRNSDIDSNLWSVTLSWTRREQVIRWLLMILKHISEKDSDKGLFSVLNYWLH